MDIVNCHIHVFTDRCIPDKFLPLQLVRWLSRKDHNMFNWILEHMNPFSDKDVLDRYLRFVRTGRLGSQRAIYDQCRGYYPEKSRMICLPMDLKYMGAGDVPMDYYDQLEEMYKTLPKEAIRFIHVDPRRDDLDVRFDELITEKGFRGIKLYPMIGYYPYHWKMSYFYDRCVKYRLPVITHCSRGNAVHYRGSRKEVCKMLGIKEDDKRYRKMGVKELCGMFCDPDHYRDLMMYFARVNWNIAHFGAGDWDDFILGCNEKDNWVNKIIRLIKEFDNCWTDVSYTMSDERYWPVLRHLLVTDRKILDRVLFGTDFYMSIVEGDENTWVGKFRDYLGDYVFTKIAVINPKVFLKEI